MIEKMKKVTLVTLKSDRDAALEALRELGVMHVHSTQARESADLVEISRDLDGLNRSIELLEEFEPRLADEIVPPLFLEIDPLELVRHVNTILEEQAWTKEELATWEHALQQAEPWGAFDQDLLETLRDGGLDIRLCAWRHDEPPQLPSHAYVQEINRDDLHLYAAVIAFGPIDTQLPDTHLSPHASDTIRENIAICSERLAYREHELLIAASYLTQLRDARAIYAEKAEFLAVRDTMISAEHHLPATATPAAAPAAPAPAAYTDRCLTLTGYVPARQIAALTAGARSHGWALITADPTADDRDVPTQITVPRWLEVSRPIFDFVGIQPGYREFDISAWFLLFLAIFFAMIIGDGGYGLIITLAALLAKAKVPKKAQVPCNLVAIFGIATIAWGAVTGVWFGIQPHAIILTDESRATAGLLRRLCSTVGSILAPLEIHWLAVDAHKDAHVQFLCFFLGALHLSLAHIWKALLAAPHPKFLSQVGWVMVLWANFLLAILLVVGEQSHAVDFMFARAYLGEHSLMDLMKPLYIVGGILILVFSNPSWNPLKAAGGGAAAIVGGGINSFVDLLSYIRLFAVGLSSYYVASSFNAIGGGMAHGVLGVLVAILVIVFGHVLNLALCGLGVLVHGVRLNTLEFSGHMGMEWAGFAFRPFARRYRSGRSD